MKIRILQVLVALFTLLLTETHLLAQFPSRKDPVARNLEFTYTTRLAPVPADAGKVRAWIPLPQSDEHQTISDLKIESPVPFKRYHEREYGNEYVYLEAPAEAALQGMEIKMRFRVLRREHRVALRGALGVLQPAALRSRPELARALAADRLVPLDGVIGALSRQETSDLKTPLEKARAIYDYVANTVRYDKSGEGWGRGDALFACDAKRGNCTDFHSLFIGMMRAAAIPARFEIGFPLPPDKTESSIGGYHCWAQFYLEPVGWIPVDSSEAWKNPDKRDYFFGAHDEHRILFTVGRDIRLNPPQDGGPLNFFIYPYVEVGGKPFKGVEYDFTFRDRPAPTNVGAQRTGGTPR